MDVGEAVTTRKTASTSREDVSGASLMTPLGLVEGEILLHLEERGGMSLRQLVHDLEWPSQLILMAVGALVREQLVSAYHGELDVVIESRPTLTSPQPPGEPIGARWKEADHPALNPVDHEERVLQLVGAAD